MSILSGKALERMKACKIGYERADDAIAGQFLKRYGAHIKNKGTLTAPGCMNKFGLSYPELERALGLLTRNGKISLDDENKIILNGVSLADSGRNGDGIHDAESPANKPLEKKERKRLKASGENKKLFESGYSEYFQKNGGFPGYNDLAGSGISRWVFSKIADGLIEKGEARIVKAGVKKRLVLKKYEDIEREYAKTSLVPVKERPLLKMRMFYQKAPPESEAGTFETNYRNFVLQNGYCPEFSECAHFAVGGAITGILGHLAESKMIRLVERNGRKEIVMKGYDKIADIRRTVPTPAAYEMAVRPASTSRKKPYLLVKMKTRSLFWESVREGHLKKLGKLFLKVIRNTAKKIPDAGRESQNLPNIAAWIIRL
jgi:hypothetical protein